MLFLRVVLLFCVVQGPSSCGKQHRGAVVQKKFPRAKSLKEKLCMLKCVREAKVKILDGVEVNVLLLSARCGYSLQPCGGGGRSTRRLISLISFDERCTRAALCR